MSNIQENPRDPCWLGKQAVVGGSKFFIAAGVEQRTIVYELTTLFADLTTQTDNIADANVALLIDPTISHAYVIEQAARYTLTAQDRIGLLYALFTLHRSLLSGETFERPRSFSPSQPLRMLNHWDNFTGIVERGYAGNSIFFQGNDFQPDLSVVRSYTRLIASVGVNAVSINNVNVRKNEAALILPQHFDNLSKIADIFRDYGVKLFLSVNFAAPVVVGGLDSADIRLPVVFEWWKSVVEKIYTQIPDFGGFLVKADSEGEPGPFTYGFDHDDGANGLARCLAPFGGLLIWRCFVYDCKQDWRDKTNDRAKAAYNIFNPLDGKFDKNVYLQIKYGPIDFQVREPVSPLFGAMPHTNHIIEFQITQEYTGHQIDLCCLLPIWKECLDFTINNTPVSDTVSGIAAVSNVGTDTNYTGHKLAQVNLYGFGRLSWDSTLTSDAIINEWLHMTFSLTPPNFKTLFNMLCTSRQVYEDYTNPLAVGFMCNPNGHYGPGIDGYEYDRWGTYHFADRTAVGRDRTLATGTAFTRLYPDDHFNIYEHLATCPDNMLLFFHHVPYSHRLNNGKTLIQHIYDTHFDGYESVERYVADWETLKEDVDALTYENVRERLKRQLQNARDWRDQVNTYFFRKSGVPDEKGRTIYD